jgi:hypothetical protein
VTTFEFAATNAAANVIGGIAERELTERFVENPGTPPASGVDEAIDIAGDALFGYGGARFGGQIADSLIPLAGVRRQIAIAKQTGRRSTRAARVAAAERAWERDYLRNAAVSGVADGANSETHSGWLRIFWNAFSRQAPPPKPKPKKDYEVEVTIIY